MGSLLHQPDFPIDYMRPRRIMFDTVGSSIDGGTNAIGESASLETSGGGMMTATLENLILEGPDEKYEILSWLGARLNGSTENIVVPLVNDRIGPFPVMNGAVRPIVKGIKHSDGSLFADGSGYSQATVYGEVVEMVSTGVIRVRVYGAARKVFRWSDWFSIMHPVKGWRIYRSWELISQTTEENPISTIAIKPKLRQAVSPGDRIELARPRCVMRLPRGVTVPFEYEGWYSSRPSISFVEAF